MSTTRPAASKTSYGLSRERIIAAALELLEREGLEGLSMRRLAERIGVTPMALYRYFHDKDELLDAVIDAEVSQAPLARLQGDWRRQLADLMRWLRDELMRHPEAVKLRLSRPIQSPGALRLTEAGMQILLKAGFARADAAYAYRTLFVFTFGSVAFGAHADPDQARRQTIAALTLLSPEEYPALASSIDEAAAAMTGDGPFEYGLSCLLNGLQDKLDVNKKGQ
jgi:AcrR family transcriptional regulator